jgi:hypothetical protein
MSDLRFSDTVRSVIQLTRTTAGEITPEVLYERERRGGKKGSALLKPADRVLRRVVQAQEASAAKYLARHEKSNGRRRDGWLSDLPVNIARAGRAGQKALKIQRLFLG